MSRDWDAAALLLYKDVQAGKYDSALSRVDDAVRLTVCTRILNYRLHNATTETEREKHLAAALRRAYWIGYYAGASPVREDTHSAVLDIPTEAVSEDQRRMARDDVEDVVYGKEDSNE